MNVTIYTIGHGNRSLEEFIHILLLSGVACVVDVRAYPKSKRHPSYSRPILSAHLEGAGISYHWLGKSLGGFRKPSAQSPHVALNGDGLRGYAEHMSGNLFLDGVEEVLSLARQRFTVLLCAERLPQDCHRSLIADHLVANGIGVVHLMEAGQQIPHRLSALARRQAGRLIYDRGSSEQLDLRL